MPETQNTIAASRSKISLREYCRFESQKAWHFWSSRKGNQGAPNEAKTAFGLTYVGRNPRSKICVSTYVRETEAVEMRDLASHSNTEGIRCNADVLGALLKRISRDSMVAITNSSMSSRFEMCDLASIPRNSFVNERNKNRCDLGFRLSTTHVNQGRNAATQHNFPANKPVPPLSRGRVVIAVVPREAVNRGTLRRRLRRGNINPKRARNACVSFHSYI